MTTDIATQKDNEPMKIFQDKVAAKIRDDIGDLMPDEMLQKLVADAIHAELYRDTNRSHYGEPKPWIQETVREAVAGKLKVYVDQQIEAHYKEIHSQVVDHIKTNLHDIIGSIIMAAVKGNASSIEYTVRDFMNGFRS